MDKQKIIAVYGPPACGKSTMSRLIYEQIHERGALIVSKDAIQRISGEYYCEGSVQLLDNIFISMIEHALKAGFTPIVDHLNLADIDKEQLEALAKIYNVEIEWIKCVVPFKEAIRRDKERKYSVGEQCIRGFYEHYFPELINDECDESKVSCT